MRATSKGLLPFSLPPSATECHRVPKLHAPILSIGQACDSSCTAILTSTQMHLLQNHDVNITMKNKPIFSGTRAPNGLWLVPLNSPTMPSTPSTQLCHSAYTQSNTKAMTKFLHASLGYPPSKTPSVNSFLLILYPFRKILYPKITSNFIAQTYLEIGREFF